MIGKQRRRVDQRICPGTDEEAHVVADAHVIDASIGDSSQRHLVLLRRTRERTDRGEYPTRIPAMVPTLSYSGMAASEPAAQRPIDSSDAFQLLQAPGVIQWTDRWEALSRTENRACGPGC